MRHVDRSALVPHAAAQMFALVDDIDSYQEFLPWCRASEVDSRTESQVVATLKVGFQALNTEFTTENTLTEPDAIEMKLVDGPFRMLEGRWTFEQLGDAGCNVTLQIRFEFSSSVQDALMGAAFERICNELIDAFIQRARDTLE